MRLSGPEIDSNRVFRSCSSKPAVALALRMWGRMHGLISLEVYGHLSTQTGDPAKPYHAELLDRLRSLGLDAEHVRDSGMPRCST
ncbi:TetR-like C-terminal domain-containing protein [Nonomuraea sp. NPDC049709]|uniref:TetR-like C-terminal domain-containing protein n=1 Tax=Nonomuraea sp. NPDC049709 TaxID=3154736 RepID=UPI00343C51A9